MRARPEAATGLTADDRVGSAFRPTAVGAKGKGFELIAVSIDEDEKALRTVAKERGFTFPVAWRYDDKTDDNFGDIIGTPTLYVVDKTGKVAWMKRGRVTYAQLQEIIEPLLSN